MVREEFVKNEDILVITHNNHNGRNTRAEYQLLRGFSVHMKYFLYLRRSFTRAWREHLLLVLLLSCAMSLPLCMSIMESSYVHAALEDNVRRGVVHDIRIENAVPGDEVYFREYEDAAVFWEDGNLYIDAHHTLTKETCSQFGDRAREIAKAHPERDWLVNSLAGLQNEEAWYRFPQKYHIAAGGFAAFLVCLTYGNYWLRKRTEIGRLTAIGAQNYQIAAMYFMHFAMLLVCAAAASLSLTAAFLWILTRRFLGYTMTDATEMYFARLPLFRFSVEWSRIVVRIGGIWLIAVLFFAMIFPLCAGGKSVRELLSPVIRKPIVPLSRKKFLPLLFCGIFRRRNNTKRILCAILAIPMLVGSLLLLQLREDPEKLRSDIPEYGFSVFLDARRCSRNTDDLRKLAEIPGVAAIADITERTSEEYVVCGDGAAQKYGYNNEQIYGYKPFLCAWENLKAPPEEMEGKVVYQAAFCRENAPAEYEIGTILECRKAGGGSQYIRIDRYVEETECAEILSVSGVFARRNPESSAALYTYEKDAEKDHDGENAVFLGLYDMFLFLRPEDWKTLNDFQRVDSFQVQITDLTMADAVENAILAYFGSGDILFFENHYADHLAAYRRAVGMNLLYTTLSVLLYVFFAVITTLSLIDYAMAHKNTIRILHMQGAPHGAILAAFAEIMLPPGLLTCAAVWAIVPPVVREYYRLRGYTEAFIAKLDMGFTGGGVAVLIAAVAVFVLPVLCTVARLLRELDDA